MSDDHLPTANRATKVEAFLAEVKAMATARPSSGRGRLIFALDATASRKATWDRASHLQGEMFEATAAIGGLDVQLAFYRGSRECKASRWFADAAELHGAMRGVSCVAGRTQIGRILTHVCQQARACKVNALVFVGDAMEEEVDELCRLASELGLCSVPVFIFHEGDNEAAGRAFRQIAKLTGGAYCVFDIGSARHLRELLGAVAAFAVGGRQALVDYGKRKGGAALLLAASVGGGS
jgi:hypothetical protein